jgi:hypothetical protein
VILGLLTLGVGGGDIVVHVNNPPLLLIPQSHLLQS